MAKVCTKQEDLETLVDELMKDQPNKQMVKKLLVKLGMDYSVDPLVQMNTVLESMNDVYFPSSKRKVLET
ncbi:MAG: hypothetical protein ACXWRE_15600 [Pseudobdellovibrionaceae bacterium]